MQVIPVASGKGGVGKSLLAANLAVAISGAGKKVVLADLDLGASNLHLVLGYQGVRTKGLGAFLSGAESFDSIILPTDYNNLSFIPGDMEIPGMSSLRAAQKASLCKKLLKLDADYLILDLGAGTHLSILDFFLLSPQGIVISSPAVTATLNAYLFLKNTVFRLLNSSIKKNSGAFNYLNDLKKDVNRLQKLYIPNLLESIEKIDPESAAVFKEKMSKFHPRLIMNMIDTPKDSERALKIKRSCKEYLNLELEHLGVVYRDSVQDVALSSRLPVVKYKPQSVISQAIFRIADKILLSETETFGGDPDFSDETFYNADLEAVNDYETKISSLEELVGSGAFSTSDLVETVKSQQYEISTLKKENQLLKKKLISAMEKGFKF